MNVILAVSAIVIAASVLYQTVVGHGPRGSPAIQGSPDYISFWKEAIPASIPIGGDSTAPLTLLVLSDLECPACRSFHRTLSDLLTQRPAAVYALYMSFPLPRHRFAESSARAAECAYAIGSFRSFLDLVYDKQDSLGFKSWASFAAEAGIADTASFAECARNPAPVPGIDAGRAFGDRIRIAGTPTVLMNGWRYPYTPSREDLDRALEAVLAGREPRGGVGLIAEPERARSN